jgi:hypothetical protein
MEDAGLAFSEALEQGRLAYAAPSPEQSHLRAHSPALLQCGELMLPIDEPHPTTSG